MPSQQTTRLSRRLAWLLRHGATETGIAMDSAGWVAVEDVLRTLAVEMHALRRAVEEDTKARLQWEGDRLRACQGHSTEGTPVTAEALEQSWRPYAGVGPLWHGTSLEVMAHVAREGLLPMARTHVHLAAEKDSKVGKRARVDLLLRVEVVRLAAHGLRVFESPNGVLLVRAVPLDAITGLATVTRNAHEQHGALLELLGIAAGE